MLRKLLLTLSICLFSSSLQSVEWMTNFEQAAAKAKAESKPLALLFTGSDWCRYCTMLEEEALNTPEFTREAGNRFIFVMVDFPKKNKPPKPLADQNEELKKKYRIRGFPTIVILDSNLKEIGTTGYRPGGGKKYAEHLLEMIKQHTAYSGQMRKLGTSQLSSRELKELYRQAKEFYYLEDANRIVKEGMRSDRADFFKIERFRYLADEGQIHDQEAQQLKNELLAGDPDNRRLTHYQIACIEFEAFSEEMEKERYSPDLAVHPLVSYAEKFGDQDKENLWRLHMIVAQVYRDKREKEKALKHVRCAYECAPERYKTDIALTLREYQ